MHHGLVHQVVGQVAGGVEAAAPLDGALDERKVLLPINVERRHGPVRNRHLRLFLHLQDTHVGVHLDHPGALEFVNLRLVVAHNHGRPFAMELLHEAPEAEIQDVIRRHHQQVLVQLIRVDGQQEVPHRPQPRLVGERPVVQNPHRLYG